MKLVRKWILALSALFLFGGAAYAQQDKDALKKRILDEVEKKLRAEEQRILDEIGKIIDEELKKSGTKPSKVDPKVEPKPVPIPAKPKGRGFLGIQPADLTEEELAELGVKGGIRIEMLTEGAPAEKAGLKEGDVILAVDGEAVADGQSLPPIIQKKGAGTTITLKILRDKKEQSIKVTLGRHPSDPAEAPEKPAVEKPPVEKPAVEKPVPEKKPADPAKPEQPSTTEEELRNRIKKFLEKDKKEPDKKEPEKKPEQPSAFSDEQIEQYKAQLEKLGMKLEQVFEKGKDGLWRLQEKYTEQLKNLGPEALKKMFGKAEEPKKEVPAKVEPKAGKPWLGIEPEELAENVREQFDLEEGVGLAVAVVKAESPAAKAGLLAGDILLKLDGKKLKGEEGLAKFMAAAKAGQVVEVIVLRKGKEQTIKVTLGEKK